MLKKLTLVTTAAIFTMTMGVANAVPAQTEPAELSSAEMDTVSAGWKVSYNSPVIHQPAPVNVATAAATALALGLNTAASATSNTVTAPNLSAASANSVSITSGPKSGYKSW